jgi:hypothetical protein
MLAGMVTLWMSLEVFYNLRYGHFVDVIRSVLQSFQSSRIAFVKQDANSAAHRLTKEVVSLAINSI